MVRMSAVIAAGFAVALGAGAAFAQTATPAAPAAPAPAAAPAAPATPMAPMKKGMKPRSAKSLACSADADKQGLHGKPRKTFMSKCKAGK
ncbi:MAG TPA: PsiF family protein [Lichenihabitans sp.]|jgi:hypothetical protein|nr:PsiF family protein [Lichenihabitans sp.]